MSETSTTVPGVRNASTPWVVIQEFVLPPSFDVPAHGHTPPHLLVMLGGSLAERDGSGSTTRAPRSIRYSPGGDRHDHMRIGLDGAHCLVLEARGFPELRLVDRICIPADGACAEVGALERCLFVDPCVSPALVEERALALFSLVRARTRPAHVVHHEWARRVRDHLDELAVSRSPLADAAKHVRRNPSIVSRVFRAMYGIPVHRYYRRRQIDRAWSLLATTGLPLGAIAARCGFTDQSHMTRVFVREARCTPARIRARMRSGDDDALHWHRAT